MLCEKCGLNEANVKVTQIINGKKTLKNLCSECAQTDDVFKNLTLGFGGIFPTFAAEKSSPAQTAVCPLCGMSLERFLSGGKAGCGECYSAFEAQASPLLKRIHATNLHSGKLSRAQVKDDGVKKKIDLLKKNLKQAIDDEKYEEAAKLRDEIKEMEGLA